MWSGMGPNNKLAYYMGIRKTHFDKDIVNQFYMCSRYFNANAETHTSDYIDNFAKNLKVVETSHTPEKKYTDQHIDEYFNDDEMELLCTSD